MNLHELPISVVAAAKATEQVKQLTERMKIASALAHMLRCQLTVARAGIVSNDHRMVVDALNEMEEMTKELHKGLQF